LQPLQLRQYRQLMIPAATTIALFVSKQRSSSNALLLIPCQHSLKPNENVQSRVSFCHQRFQVLQLSDFVFEPSTKRHDHVRVLQMVHSFRKMLERSE
jgi:hypothetical protein